MRRLKALYTWFDSRLQLGEPIKEMALHPVPNKTASWWYVFGSAAFVLLMLQIVTGILLALVYLSSAGQALNSLNVLNHQLTLGWFLLAMHGCGPALDLVATRLMEDQLIRQVLQGGGNMPAYGKNLSPSETAALVQFLETLHPINQPAAADASRQAAMAEPAAKP